MALYLVTYDLRKQGQDYDALYERIKACGNAWHGMQNVWFVHTDRTASDIVNHVRLALDANDKVFVSRINEAAWWGFPAEADKWIQDRAK